MADRAAPLVPRVPAGIGAAIALLPATIISACAIVLNRFTFIDDGAMLVQSLARFVDSFRVTDSGRFYPLYQLYPWLVARILGTEPWAFSLVNGLFFVVAVAPV